MILRKIEVITIVIMYKEKASDVRAFRSELQRMIGDLQQGDVMIAGVDRNIRLPIDEVLGYLTQLKKKGKTAYT
ncbi:hypothetical protein J3U09_01370 [Gilliamella sp. B2889]|nr:hypothetical protein [Gilliamella sp. B2889]